MTPSFRCPHCAETLHKTDVIAQCANGHSFDVAKQGYVNLMPGGRLKGRPAGDSEAMVAARSNVFDHGLYQPIIDRVAAVVGQFSPEFVLDSGCGEGTYLANVTRTTGAGGWGIDISKAAVKSAARRHRDHQYAVASSYALPFADASFDVVINVFAPRSFIEMRRVLRPTGVAIVVTPGPEHLHELKSAVYEETRSHEPDVEPSAVPAHEELVKFGVDLAEADHRLALLQMTPFWWSTSDADKQRVVASLTVATAEMRLSIYPAASPLHGQ